MADTKKYYHNLDVDNNKVVNLLLNPLTTAQRLAVGTLLTLVDQGYVCYDTTLNEQFFWDGTAWVTSVALTTWGSITGSITSQTDLTAYLAANYYPLLTNPAGYLTLGTLPSVVTPTLQQVVNTGNGISNFGGIGNASIQSTNFTNGRTLYLNDNAFPTIRLVDNANASNFLQIDLDTLNIDGVSYNWSTIVNPPTSPLVALPFTTDHLATTNNEYVIGDVVWYAGNVYRCIANNDSLQPNIATQYWTLLGTGFPLVQQPSDWNSTSGNNQILNKPTIPTVGTWGALNYPTWTSGTPFVKMTAVGTFALDTNTYLTSAWGLSGNAGTTPSTNFIGTTDDVDFTVKRNNADALVFYRDRNISFNDRGTGLSLLATGTQNIGINANLSSITTGNSNIIVGTNSLITTGSYNVIFGDFLTASNLSTGGYNFLSGAFSAYNLTTGSHNIAIGYGAYGNQFLSGSITGTANVAIGQFAGSSYSGWTSGSNNVLIGRQAGYNFIGAASNNIAIGNEANTFTFSGATRSTGSNNIIIGNTIHLGDLAGSNQLNIGNLIYGTALDGTYSTISTGNIGIGVKNPSQKLEVLGNIRFSGALMPNNLSGTSGQVLTSGGTGVAPTWTTITVPTVIPSALTKTDDTNVTLTLGGSPSTALLAATSLTLGWTGTLADSRIASATTWNAKLSDAPSDGTTYGRKNGAWAAVTTSVGFEQTFLLMGA